MQICGAGSRGGKGPKSPDRKMSPDESTSAHLESRKVGAKPPFARDVTGLVWRADCEPCNRCTPAIVHGESEKLCIACHMPPRDWTQYSPGYRQRANRFLKDAKKGGVAQPIAVLKGYRPSTDSLCTSHDCIVRFMSMRDQADRVKRYMCAVCIAYKLFLKALAPYYARR